MLRYRRILDAKFPLPERMSNGLYRPVTGFTDAELAAHAKAAFAAIDRKTGKWSPELVAELTKKSKTPRRLSFSEVEARKEGRRRLLEDNDAAK
jgi:hypothetical protein